VRRRGVFLFNIASASDADIGKAVFVKDDQTVGLVAEVSNPIYVGNIFEVESATKVWVEIYPALLQTDVATHISDASGAHAASAISVADSGSKITATDVEAALAEVMTGIKTAQYTLFPQAITLEDGTAVGKFTSEDQPSVGWAQLSNKELALRGSVPPKSLNPGSRRGRFFMDHESQRNAEPV